MSDMFLTVVCFCRFFFNDTATTEIYTLSLHDALPIYGSYTQLEIQWEGLDAKIETAHIGKDLVILISQNSIPGDRMKVIIESGMLWNRQGHLSRKKDYLKAVCPKKTIKVFTTSVLVDNDPYIDVKTPYLAVWLDGEIGISTGKKRTLSEIKKAIYIQKTRLRSEAEKFGELAEVYIAVQAGIAWNLIRSEEHTSELQSQAYLVCRLLLEKKKQQAIIKSHKIGRAPHTTSNMPTI